MARFDVYSQGQRGALLLDVQSDLLEGLSTCVVVPLLPLNAAPKPAEMLNPLLEVNGKTYAMVTQFMASVPRAELKKWVGNLESDSMVILAAIDFLHQGW